MNLITNGCFLDGLTGWDEEQLLGNWTLSVGTGAKNATPACPQGKAVKWGPEEKSGGGEPIIVGRLWQHVDIADPGAYQLSLYWRTVRGDWADVSIIEEASGERRLNGRFGPEMGRGWRLYVGQAALGAGRHRVEIRASWVQPNSLGWKFNGIRLAAAGGEVGA